MTAAVPYGPPVPAPRHIGGWCWSAPGDCGIADTYPEALKAQARAIGKSQEAQNDRT